MIFLAIGCGRTGFIRYDVRTNCYDKCIDLEACKDDSTGKIKISFIFLCTENLPLLNNRVKDGALQKDIYHIQNDTLLIYLRHLVSYDDFMNNTVFGVHWERRPDSVYFEMSRVKGDKETLEFNIIESDNSYNFVKIYFKELKRGKQHILCCPIEKCR